MRTFLKNKVSGEEIEVTATTEHPDSSYGHPVWVDKNNLAYCEVGREQPFYELINRSTHREIIGQQLATLREKRGLSTRQLADMCGLSFSNISKIERGSYNVSIDLLSKVCEALGADIRIIEKEIENGEA